MRSLKSLKHALIVCAITLCVPVIANATPSLGAQSAFTGAYEEFGSHDMASSATDLNFTVWFGRDYVKTDDIPGMSDADYAADIWLVTNSADGVNFFYGGDQFAPMTLDPNKKVAAYHDNIDGPVTYYGINLGNVLSGGWALAPTIFSPGEFYFNSNTLTYSNLKTDEWLFALGDISGGNEPFFDKNGRNHDEFGPQTTGSTVPEPASMLLFGTGLAGLAGSRLRRKKK